MTQLRSVTRHMGSHSVTCYPTQVNTHRITPAMQAGTRFTYPGRMEGCVDLVDMIAPRPGVAPATFRSRVQRSTNATTRTTSLINYRMSYATDLCKRTCSRLHPVVIMYNWGPRNSMWFGGPCRSVSVHSGSL